MGPYTTYNRRTEVISLPPLREAYLHLTNRCRGGCPHCYASATARGSGHELTTAQWQDVMDQLAALGTSGLVFVGGDPFERDDLYELIDYAIAAKGAKLRIFYNRFISPDEASRLRDVGNGQLTMVVSLEGPDAASNDRMRGPGNLERTVAGMRNLMEVGLTPVVNVVPTAYNQHLLVPLAEFLTELGVQRMHLLFLQDRGVLRKRRDLIPDTGTLTEHVLALKHRAEELGLWVDNFGSWAMRIGGSFDFCNASYNLLAIADDGTVYGCPMSVGDPNLAAGNVREQPLEAIWRGAEKLREMRDASFLHREACACCDVAPFCGGDCMLHGYYHAEAETGKGDYAAEDPYCEMLKAVYAELVQSPPQPMADWPLPTYIECT